MANEINLTASLTAYKSSCMSSALSRAMTGLQVTMSGTTYSMGSVSVGTSAEAVPLGEVTAPGWCFLVNKDATNYITIRNGSTGADMVQIKAGEFAIFRMYGSAVPYALANTGACIMEFLILSA